MKLLLHTCCAPCLLFPHEALTEKGFLVKGFFYNPNIHGPGEHKSRKQAVAALAERINIEVLYPEYRPLDYFRAVCLKEEFPLRCSFCWDLRLKQTAKQAREMGFEFFSTTLLVSPYQNQALLKSIGEDIAKKEGVGFYYEDFRPGFRKAHEQAKALGIYCQKYCGCIYSEVERCKKSVK